MTAETLVVTGLSSFLGTHLARAFARMGFRVLGTITRPVAAYDEIRGKRIQVAMNVGVEVHPLDVTDAVAMRRFVERELPAVWVHHAGWATDYGNPTYDLERGHAVNVAPLRSLYEALIRKGARGLLLTGSSMEYGDSDQPARETDACWPSTPYGLSKLAATIRARQLAHELGLRTRVARIFIPFGPFDHPQKLLPSAVAALRATQPIDLSPCEQARDFVHADDVTRGYEALVDDLGRPQPFDLFNLCSSEAITLKQLLREIAGALQADPGLLRFGKRVMRPGEPPVSFGDNNRARAVLGWQPRPLAESLRAYLLGPENES